MTNDDLTRSVGLRLQIRRENLGLSQDRLAALAKLDRTSVGKIERGERGTTVATLHRLAASLDTTMSNLLEGL
jgi:transcriptional regulator with XRE-family HTH domain